MNEDARLRAIAQHAVRVRIALLALAALTYALAWYVWTLGQAAGAVVLAVFGYAVLRTRRKLVLRLTRRRFAADPFNAWLIAQQDADTLAGGVAAMRRRCRQAEKEDQS